MDNSLEKINNIFNSFYRFVVGFGIFIMVSPFILLWFLTFMYQQVNEIEKLIVGNYNYITATSSEINLYTAFYKNYINYFCGVPLFIVEVAGIIIIILGCFNWYNKEQKPKDDKAYNESVILKNEFEKRTASQDEKIENDKNLFRDNNNKNKIVKRLNMYRILRKQFRQMLIANKNITIVENVKFILDDNSKFIFDFLSISKINKHDIIYDIKFRYDNNSNLKEFIVKYNDITKQYNYEHGRYCNIEIVYMLYDEEYDNSNLVDINKKIKLYSHNDNISATIFKIKDSYTFE